MSTKKEYIIEAPVDVSATTISWLENIQPVDVEKDKLDKVLLAVSVPNYEVQDTHYMSKNITIKQLKDVFVDDLTIVDIPDLNDELASIHQDINALVDISAKISTLTTGSVVVNGQTTMQLSDPYVLSSIQYEDGNITSLSGYKLKAALANIIPTNTYSKGSFSQLVVNNEQITAVKLATTSNAGIVKAKTATAADDVASALDVVIDSSGSLKIPKNKIIQAIKNDVDFKDYIKAQIFNELKTEIEAELSKKFYKTEIVQTPPASYDTNTIYYVIDGDT